MTSSSVPSPASFAIMDPCFIRSAAPSPSPLPSPLTPRPAVDNRLEDPHAGGDSSLEAVECGDPPYLDCKALNEEGKEDLRCDIVLPLVDVGPPELVSPMSPRWFKKSCSVRKLVLTCCSHALCQKKWTFWTFSLPPPPSPSSNQLPRHPPGLILQSSLESEKVHSPALKC
jgi:hypothetical protein